MSAFPLEELWAGLRERLAAAPSPPPTGVTRELCLDLAEHIVRAATAWMDPSGAVVDPHHGHPDQFSTARFVGALGNLIAAGRCDDLRPACVAAYDNCLARLPDHTQSPEFFIKELMYAHAALKERVDAATLARWERAWAAHDPRRSYNCVVSGLDHNLNVFALAGEFFKRREGLADHTALIEDLLAGQGRHFTPAGMYRDPGDPITYDLVVRQQLDLLLSHGYDGPNADWVREACRRGALASLLMQSVTGQTPFGGRSNQFHFVEAHFACMCEAQARMWRDRGDAVTAGAFKRAGRRAVAMTVPWVLGMKPLRQLKQGFDPALEHGIDSGGYYSVYGLLMASLCATAYHLADDSIPEHLTPAELGGYVVELFPAFHKVFATCAGYHVELDTRADLHKDATGLGRLHRAGAWPETALSASITATPRYAFAFPAPARCLAIGPAWTDAQGGERRLAELSGEIADVRVTVKEQSERRVAFEVRYEGDLAGAPQVTERYRLDADGLAYESSPEPAHAWLLVPVIIGDGAAEARCVQRDGALEATYRGTRYEVRGHDVRLTDDPPAGNRNALYRTARIEGRQAHLRLVPDG